jgi:hypothetical protein
MTLSVAALICAWQAAGYAREAREARERAEAARVQAGKNRTEAEAHQERAAVALAEIKSLRGTG